MLAQREISILVEGVLRMTVPRSGFNKLVESYRPLSTLPNFGVEPVYFHAEGFSPKARNDARKAIYDSTAERNTTYDEAIQEQLRNDPRDYYRDILPRVNESYTLSYPTPDAESFRRAYPLIVERVADQEASYRYLRGMVKVSNRSKTGSNRLERIPCPTGELYVKGANTEKVGYTKYGYAEAAYYGDDSWYMMGPYYGITRQLQATYPTESNEPVPEDSFESCRGKIESLKNAAREGMDPFMINSYSSLYWNMVADTYLSPTPSLNQAHNISVEDEPNGERIKRNEKRRPTLPDNQILELISSKDELKRIIANRMIKALANSYGEQCVLCFQSEDRLRINGAVFQSK